MNVNITIDTDNPPLPSDFYKLGMWALSVSKLPENTFTAEELAESKILSAAMPKTPGQDSVDSAFGVAPAPAAPPVPPPTTQPPMTSAEYDASGMPWDERLHSGNRTKKQDGTWTRKKGVPPQVFDSIAATLPRGPASAPAAPPVPPPVGTAPVAPPVVPPAAPATTPLPTSDAAGLAAIHAAVVNGALDIAIVNQACGMLGAKNLMEASKVPGNATEIHAFLQAQNPAAFAA